MDKLLIEAIKSRASDPLRATEGADVVPAKAFPPASPAQLADAERALGFALPNSMRELYLRVGNGGYGPGYGLIGVADGAADDNGKRLVELYASFAAADPDDPHWRWPPRLLPVAHLGCAMYVCIDCSTPEERVVWFEPNPHADGEPWDDSFIPLAPSMTTWLESWLAGRDLLENAWQAKSGKDGSSSG